VLCFVLRLPLWINFLLVGLLSCQSQSPKIPAQTPPSSDTVQKDTKPPFVFHPYWSDLARVIGGLPPRDTLYWRSAITDTAWQSHAKRMDYLWTTSDKKLFTPLRQWAQTELGPYHHWKGFVFYPFSGADWPSIYALYPNGQRYVFFGLEQEGDPAYVRLLSPQDIANNLWGPYAAMADLLRLSFFKTKEMQQFLIKGKVRGLLPVFLAFFARSGYDIYEVNHIYLTSEGKIDTIPQNTRKPSQSPWDTLVTGLRFLIGKPDQTPQEVIYVSFNAANDGLKRQTGILPFLQTIQPCVTFIKAASYLMHGQDFSQIRSIILTQSVAILQEDSGIPYRFFDSTSWKVQLYGVYNGPIPLFRNKFQQNLYQAYRSQSVKPLPFGIGYHLVPGTSNLLLAVRKNPNLPLTLPVDTPTTPKGPTPAAAAGSRQPALSSVDTLPPSGESPQAPPTEAPSGDSE